MGHLDTKLPSEMSRSELLRHCDMLTQKVVFLNAEVRKAEANAVQTVGALVHAAGGEVTIDNALVLLLPEIQLARTPQPDGSVVFKTRLKPKVEEQEVAP